MMTQMINNGIDKTVSFSRVFIIWLISSHELAIIH